MAGGTVWQQGPARTVNLPLMPQRHAIHGLSWFPTRMFIVFLTQPDGHIWVVLGEGGALPALLCPGASPRGGYLTGEGH